MAEVGRVLEPEFIDGSEENAVDTTGMSVVEAKAAQCRQRLEGAYKAAAKNYLVAANAILEAYENDYFEIWGHGNLQQYAEEVLGMKKRAAYQFLHIAQAVRARNLDEDVVQRIGWTKMREISESLIQATDEEEADELLELAEKNSRAKLVDELKSRAGLSPGRAKEEETFRLSLAWKGRDSYKAIQDALELAYQDIGSEDPKSAFERICGDWLMARDDSSATTLEALIEFAKNQFNVDLVPAAHDDAVELALGGREEHEEVSGDQDVETLLGIED